MQKSPDNIIQVNYTKNPNIPDIMEYLFSDTNFAKLDYDKHWFYIIERTLLLGRPEQIRWILNTYDDKQIKEVIKKSRVLDKQTVNFWCIRYKIQRNETLCFTKQYPNPHWEY